MASDAAHPNPDVARRLNYIYTLHRTEIDLRLGASPYLDLLEKLGSPHKKLKNVIHVAGTNGKGSVLAFLRAMAEADGKTVNVYTSPHLITFNERIRIHGKLIDDSSLIDLYDRVHAANDGAPVTFFEFTTAMAMLAFAESPADITLLETGMGGRLDCTNVIDRPLATAITKISFDHIEFLGDSLEKIAAEKAGIMKPGVPCVIGRQMDDDAVIPVFQAHAREIGAPIINAVMPDGYPAPSLTGAHQVENAAVAMMLARILSLSDAAKRKGLVQAEWPARLQRITSGPLAGLLPAGWELWFDAAHNDSGALALAAQLRLWREEKPVHLIAGLAADKDERQFFKALSGAYNTLSLVDLPQARKPRSAADLAARLDPATKNLLLTSHYEKSLTKEAVGLILQTSKDPGARIVICGSLYLYNGIV